MTRADANFVRRGTTILAGGLLLVGITVASVRPAAGTENTGGENTSRTDLAVSPKHRVDPLDWPFWRGPEYNGISRETGLVSQWDPNGGPGSNVAWKREDAGGRSTPIVMRGKLYTIVRADPETPREGEKVICLDAATGEKLWENRFNVFLSDVPDTRVGWSSCVGDPSTGRVYALGVCGFFQCLDGDTGETIWSHSLHEEFGLLSTYGGRTNFPVVFEDTVIVSAVIIGWGDMAKPAHRFLAFDNSTGEVVWFRGTHLFPDDTTYSSAVPAVLNGQQALVFGSGDGDTWALQPRTGLPIWNFSLSMRGLNVTPLVVGDRVYMCNSEENIDGVTMGSVVAIDGTFKGDITKTGEKWRVDELVVGKSSPVAIEDRLYVIDDRAKLHVLDTNTGKRIGDVARLGTVMRASPLYADGKIYAFTANGRAYVLEPDEKRGVRIVHRARLPSGEECHASPICSHGRIYLQTTGGLYCLFDPDARHDSTPRPAVPQERSVSADATPAYLQVVPCEVVVKPGETQHFEVRQFNSSGQLLGKADAKLEVVGPGSISSDGTYTASAQNVARAVTVRARHGELQGEARIRVLPDLPWSYDFQDGQVPVTWVGARYRHVPIDFDLLQSLKTSNPLASQLYIYLTSDFVNTGLPKLTYDNSTPQQKLAAFLRFLAITEQATDLQEARKALEPSLRQIADQDVISGWEWSELENSGLRLTLTRGSRPLEGNGVITKITTIPKGARSRCWFGRPDLHDYTIQADVLGAIKDGKMPDIGLIAQGYEIDMKGASQKLQIRSWYPTLRMARTIDFSWTPDTWYTIKFRAEVTGGQAILRGKVWPRGQREPEAWDLEATDQSPNLAGSPGLFGNAKDAEIFLDNVVVRQN